METVLLVAQLMCTSALAAWISTGVWDNIFHPTQNESYTSEVLEMRRIREEFPAAYNPVAHRAITNRRTQLLAFRTVVVAELLACALLWVGAIMLGLAVFAVIEPYTARAVAILGAAAFSAVWMGMLIVGNYFCYWFGHEGAQNTHFQLALWGLGTMIFLAL